MTHSISTRSILFVAALAAFAVSGAGCAMNAGEPGQDESAESTTSTTTDLRKAPVANANAAPALSDEEAEANKTFAPKAAIAPRLVGPAPVISGGQDDDGPRPHPWSPSPETTETNTNSGSSGSSSSQ